MDTEPSVFVGIDWASSDHQVCLLGGGNPVQRVFAHDAVGIGAMVDWLSTQAERPEQVGVAIETPHGPIVEALMDRGIAVFAINPKQLDPFRDRFSPAGAKDDRRDALVLASPCAPTATAFVEWKLCSRLSLNCASGLAWPRNLSRSAVV